MTPSISFFPGQIVAQDNTLSFISPTQPKKTSSLFDLKSSSSGFKAFKKRWEYADDVIGLSSNAMNTIARTGRWISHKASKALKHTAQRLDLFSIVNIPINLTKIPSKIQKIWNSIQWKDREGAVLATFSFTLFIGNMFDTLTAFVNSVLEVLSHQEVGWISKMALPLALTLIGADLVLECKRLYHLLRFHHKFNHEIIKKSQSMQCSSGELQDLVSPFLKKHLGIDKDGEPSFLKAKILKRRTTGEIVSQFKELSTILRVTDTPPEIKQKELSTRLKMITKLLKKEEISQNLSILATLISTVAVGLFFNSSAALVSFSLLTLSAIIGLGIKIYENRS